MVPLEEVMTCLSEAQCNLLYRGNSVLLAYVFDRINFPNFNSDVGKYIELSFVANVILLSYPIVFCNVYLVMSILLHESCNVNLVPFNLYVHV